MKNRLHEALAFQFYCEWDELFNNMVQCITALAAMSVMGESRGRSYLKGCVEALALKLYALERDWSRVGEGEFNYDAVMDDDNGPHVGRLREAIMAYAECQYGSMYHDRGIDAVQEATVKRKALHKATRKYARVLL